MRLLQLPAARGLQPIRLWWALPTFAVAATAIGLGVVVGPTLGEHVTIPHQLVLPAQSPTAAPARPATVVTHTPAARPTPKPTVAVTPAPAWTPVQQTHVVTPRRSVVTASSDDGREREPTARESESGDR